MERYIEYIFKRRNELRNKERIEHKKGKQKNERKIKSIIIVKEILNIIKVV